MGTIDGTGDTQRIRYRRVLLAPVAALLLAACGGADDDTATTTTSVASSTTSTSAAPASTTTAKVGTTARPTPAEPAGTDLADGSHPVYLAGVDTAKRTITVDVVQVLDRRSPEAATVCPEIASGDIDGYCIKNANTRLRTLPVAARATIQVLNGSALRSTDIAGLAAARQPRKELSFFEITLTSGRVTSVKELYRP